MTDKILEKDLSYRIVGCVYDTANKYGKGLKEIIYQRALAENLEKNGLKFKEQKRIDIFSVDSGKKLGTYVPDFVIEDKIILEIKASNFTRMDDVNQQRSYLRANKYEIAYLINFNTEELDIRRSIYTNDRKSFVSILE